MITLELQFRPTIISTIDYYLQQHRPLLRAAQSYIVTGSAFSAIKLGLLDKKQAFIGGKLDNLEIQLRCPSMSKTLFFRSKKLILHQ